MLGRGVAAIFGFEEDSLERADGPFLVDYLGIPINAEGRARALAYDSALLGVPEHVCMRHPSQYSFWGPARLRIESELDANLDVIAYRVGGTFRRADRTIWMDGRPHPSKYARAHLGRLHHRRVARFDARHDDDAPEMGLDSQERCALERSGDRRDLLHAE